MVRVLMSLGTMCVGFMEKDESLHLTTPIECCQEVHTSELLGLATLKSVLDTSHILSLQSPLHCMNSIQQCRLAFLELAYPQSQQND